jgi:hypothetical protein
LLSNFIFDILIIIIKNDNKIRHYEKFLSFKWESEHEKKLIKDEIYKNGKMTSNIENFQVNNTKLSKIDDSY